MDPKYSVRMLTSQGGEDIPILKNISTGLPEYEANVYVLCQHRQKSLASSTIERVLREIASMHIYFDYRAIDLELRLAQGEGLSLQEIDGLAAHCARPANKFFLSSIEDNNLQSRQMLMDGSKIEKVRMRPEKSKGVSICKASYSNRLVTIRAYLGWRIDQFLSHHMTMASGDKQILRTLKKEMMCWITARIPKDKGRNQVGRREGLEAATVDRLLSITDCNSPENPWKNRHCRIRNAMIIAWFLQLGIRRGELMGVKISDIDFQKETVLIARRPDDPEDQRKKHPNTKTLDRVLPMSAELASITHNYIMNYRRRIGSARLHPYLVVADDTGSPLTLDGLNKIFRDLRKLEIDLPDLFPHLFRHTWNDGFSETMDAKNVPAAEEEQMRSYLMGWSSTSSTSQIYTRRTIRKRAQRASIEMQEGMVLPRGSFE